jgi:diacylglycerol kinase family enzyme
VAVLVGNGALYGGGFRVFHMADNRDSQLDVLIFKEAGYRMLLDSVWGLAHGGFDSVASTAYLRAAAFSVTAAIPVPVEVDGELLGRFAATRFTPAASRLRVVAPRETAVNGRTANPAPKREP